MQVDQQLTFDRYGMDLHNGQLWRGELGHSAISRESRQ